MLVASCATESSSVAPTQSEITETQSPTSNPPSFQSDDPKVLAINLATQLSSAGIGCENPELQQTPILFDGARVDCIVKGAEFRIEVYSVDKFPEMVQYLVENGFGSLSALTNGTSWVCTGSDSALDEAQSIFGGSVALFEDL